MVLEKTLESPLDCKETKPVHCKWDQSCKFIERTDVEAESPILGPPDAKNWLIWKDPDAGKKWRQQKGTTKNEMVGWHRRLNGHGFGWTPGVADGQGALACCGSWSHKESDTTEQVNWTEFRKILRLLLFYFLNVPLCLFKLYYLFIVNVPPLKFILQPRIFTWWQIGRH